MIVKDFSPKSEVFKGKIKGPEGEYTKIYNYFKPHFYKYTTREF